MKYKIGYVLFVLLSLFDLVVSYLILNPELEANPFMKMLWLSYGYGAIITYKCLTTTIGLIAFRVGELKCPRLVMVALIIVNGFLLVTCGMLTYVWFILGVSL